MTATMSRRDLARRALQRSVEVRRSVHVDVNTAVDPFDVADRLGITVQFVDVSMEGFYRVGKRPRILLSALRPLVRRVYNCAHELGHHAYGHHSTLDGLLEGCARDFQPEEFVADTFAGFLLMPPLGVQRAFTRRGWTPATTTPEQMLTIACAFGVGYETLVEHCRASLEVLSHARADALLQQPVRKVREAVLGQSAPAPLVIVDAYWELPTIDVEVGMQMLLPAGSVVDGRVLKSVEHRSGALYRAGRVGIGRVEMPGGRAAFLRVTRHQYVGLSTNRHLEDNLDDD